jgi:hypothetical protein
MRSGHATGAWSTTTTNLCGTRVQTFTRNPGQPYLIHIQSTYAKHVADWDETQSAIMGGLRAELLMKVHGEDIVVVCLDGGNYDRYTC